jgi:signal peptidase I
MTLVPPVPPVLDASRDAPRSVFREYLEALLVAAVFLGFSNTFVVKTFYIPSGSMEKTLLVGDHLFVNRFVYGQNPTGGSAGPLPARGVRRGDIVIFRSVKDPGVDMVKRCVAIGGDVVEIRDKALFVNGSRIPDQSFAVYSDPHVYPAHAGIDQGRRDNFGPYSVPEDKFFCMGDNRDASYDSRFWGPVPAGNVKGRPVLVYWSFGGGTSDGVWRGWGQRLQQFGRTAIGFFTKSRWDRTFRLIR